MFIYLLFVYVSLVSLWDCGSLKWPFFQIWKTKLWNDAPSFAPAFEKSVEFIWLQPAFSELNGVVKTTCVIDAVQAATYLGKAVVNIYRAEICPDGEPLGCTAPMNWMWVISFWT